MTTTETRALAAVIARRVFARRENHAEVHIREAELTTIIEIAVEAALRLERGTQEVTASNSGGPSLPDASDPLPASGSDSPAQEGKGVKAE